MSHVVPSPDDSQSIVNPDVAPLENNPALTSHEPRAAKERATGARCEPPAVMLWRTSVQSVSALVMMGMRMVVSAGRTVPADPSMGQV